MEILHRLNRFGQNKEIDKGTRRSLYYLKAIIQNPQPEEPALLASMGFKAEELLAYRNIILNPELKDPTTYTYGNRLRQYYGIDALLEVARKFKVDPMDNRGFISTWDTKRDTAAALNLSVPCLTNLYFFNENGQITLSADFRTHSAVSAWLTNTYGLRAIQELVCKEAGIPPGRLIVNSRWIAIDPNDAKTKAALETVQKQRTTPIQVNDPQGYFVCNTNGDTIVLEHFTSTGTKLGEYTGKTAESIKNMLRRDSAVSNPDHAVWIGMELMKAELSTNTKI
jgi:thymidylate synthase